MAARPQVIANQLVRFPSGAERRRGKAIPRPVQLTVVMQLPAAVGQPDGPGARASKIALSHAKTNKQKKGHSVNTCVMETPASRKSAGQEDKGLNRFEIFLVLAGLPLLIPPLLILFGFSALRGSLAELLLFAAYMLIVAVPLRLRRHISRADFAKLWNSSLGVLSRIVRPTSGSR
jgi:hypothetical protein